MTDQYAYLGGTGCAYRGLDAAEAAKYRAIAAQHEGFRVEEDDPERKILVYTTLHTVDEFLSTHMDGARRHLAVERGGRRARREYRALTRKLERVLRAAARRGETVTAPIGTTYHPRYPWDYHTGLIVALWGVWDHAITWSLRLCSTATDRRYTAIWAGAEHHGARTADALLRRAFRDRHRELHRD